MIKHTTFQGALLLLTVAGLTVLLLSLPPMWQRALFVGVTLTALTVGFWASLRRAMRDKRRWLDPARWRKLADGATWFSAVTAVALMVLSAHFFRPESYETADTGFRLLLAGTLALGLALLLAPKAWQPQAEALSLPSGKPVAFRWRWVLFGVMLLAMLVQTHLAGTSPQAQRADWPLWMRVVSPHVQMALLVGGWGCVLWGLGGGRLTPALLERFRVRPHHLLLLGIVVLAVALRFYRLDDWITRFIDEMHYARAIGFLKNWDTYTPYVLMPFGEVTAFTWLYPYVQWGTSILTTPSLAGLRLLSALVGVAQVIAVYFLGRTAFDRKVGLLAALLLATFPPHLHFSRIGINNIADPLMGTLAFAFLLRGLRGGRRLDFALAGASLGLTQYFYEGGRLFYVPFALLWLTWLALFRRRDGGYARLDWRHGLAFGGTLLAFLVPVYYAWTVSGGDLAPRFTSNVLVEVQTWLEAVEIASWRIRGTLLFNRFDAFVLGWAALTLALVVAWRVRIGRLRRRGVLALMVVVALPLTALYLQWLNAHHQSIPLNPAFVPSAEFLQTLLKGVLDQMRRYVQYPDLSWFYGGQTAMILVYLVPLFLLGIAQLFWRARSPGGALLLWWLIAVPVGNSLVRADNGMGRYLVVFPAVALTMAVGLRYTLPLIARGWLNRLRQPRLMLAVILGGLALIQGVYYFGVHMPNAYRDKFYHMANDGTPLPDTDDALLRAVELPPGTDVHIVSRNLVWNFNLGAMPLYYERPDLQLRHVYPEGFTAEYFDVHVNRRVTRHQAFFLEAGDATSLQVLRSFRDVELGRFSPHAIPLERQMVLYFSPALFPELNALEFDS